MTTSEAAGAQPPVYKRKMRNYLLDVGLQLRYTATIVVVAIFLTAGLGFKMYQATREISRIILFTGLADPATAQELQGAVRQQRSDRPVGDHRVRDRAGAVDQRGRHPHHAQGGGAALQDLQPVRARAGQPDESGAAGIAKRGRAAGFLHVVPGDARGGSRARDRRRPGRGQRGGGHRGQRGGRARRRCSVRSTSSAS